MYQNYISSRADLIKKSAFKCRNNKDNNTINDVFSFFSSFIKTCLFIFSAAASNARDEGHRDPLNSLHGPGSVLVSEIDLSSPLNYGTPSSLGSFRTPGHGTRGTPIRIRSDIQSERKLRQVNVAPGSQVPGSSSRGEGAGKF